MPAASPLPPKTSAWLTLAVVLCALIPAAGCPAWIATGIYLWEGGNLVDAEFDGLKQKRVVVFCRPPSSSNFSHAGAARQIAQRVSSMLEQNVPRIDLVSPQEVDQWMDENDSEDCKALGKAVKADRVLQIDLEHFDLYSGKTLYQGNSVVMLTVFDMEDRGRRVWDRDMGEYLFPVHGGVPIQDRSPQQFQRQYVEILSGAIARHFYKHDPHVDFATDALSL